MELKSKYNIGQLLKTKHTYEDANAQLHMERASRDKSKD